MAPTIQDLLERKSAAFPATAGRMKSTQQREPMRLRFKGQRRSRSIGLSGRQRGLQVP